jgi:hypothetical protein
MEVSKMKSRSKSILGSILIMAGAVTLLGNLNILNENFILPILGIGFLAVYFMLGARKSYGNIGFLIPGIILSALQIFKIADDNNVSEKTEIIIVFGVFSICFLLMYLIHTCWFKELSTGKRNWPLYVSIAFLFFGGIVYAIEYLDWKFGMVLLNNMWPVILVLVGASMLYKALKGDKQKLEEDR